MKDDERALLAAIVADPADDTVRLAYADCIEDRGNAARAAFIRLQIEAERLHPDSNARAALERQAEALFAEHWIDWWGEVCAAVGLPKPLPKPKPNTWLGRLARRVGLGKSPEEPYEVRSETTILFRPEQADNISGDRRESSQFRRGFPDRVHLPFRYDYTPRPFLPRWTTTAPLASLSAFMPTAEHWPDGPHLAGVQSLELNTPAPAVLFGVLESPHLTALRELNWTDFFGPGIPEYDWAGMVDYANLLAQVVVVPRVRQLERLSLPVPSLAVAEIIACAPNLAGLQSLHIKLTPELCEDFTGRERLAILARSPHLAGLRELVVRGNLDAAGVAAVIRSPTWTGLTKLDLEVGPPGPSNDLEPLVHPDGLPNLTELRLGGLTSSLECLDALARSPLLKRHRHFACSTLYAEHSHLWLSRFLEAVDPARIETYAFGVYSLSDADKVALRTRFGDRLRLRY